ncbi:MAG: sulfatase-like hydrolase/transferase [Tannerellaceae bacterium]|jgi:phosphoglycerol transferase MdoB-like AlkP superfamily enzyme|nr:sulfatase-like hydrolase/transferase [Tannerellaceae bacterium]
MKQRLQFLLLVFAGWLPVLAIQKPVFMLYHYDLAQGSDLAEWLRVIWYGLRLDSAIAGYLSILPLLFTAASIWMPGAKLKVWLKVYFAVASLLIAMVFAGDMALYTFWGFRLDATVIFYMQFPSGAATSVPAGLFVRQAILVVVYALASTWTFNRWIVPLFPEQPAGKKSLGLAAIVLAGGLLLVSAQGGATGAHIHVGTVYFSPKQFLNHSAINPVFSLVSSLFKQHDFASQFQFFPEDERERLFCSLMPAKPAIDCQAPDSAHLTPNKVELLNTERPNILLIILESFSANAIGALSGPQGVTPHLDSLSREGVLFTNVYANSFRTDRGLVSVLNGYPAQPTTSIMKYPAKSATLPSLAKSLATKGYTAEMLYGSDIRYTNMQSYFYGSGYNRITSDKDLPTGVRRSKLGIDDEIMFDYLYHSLAEREDTRGRFFSTFLTLSSHEPFDVPFHRLGHPYLNSIAFTDSCIGDFVGKLRQTRLWDDLLLIFVADHGFPYPERLKVDEPARYHIPILWVGGAVKGPARIDALASQTDLAATLLGQLGLRHDDFRFSKDVFDNRYPPYAFYTFSNGFGLIDSVGVSTYDNDSNRPISQLPADGSALRIDRGKALLQTLYDDMGSR